MELRELAAMVKLYRACRLAINEAEISFSYSASTVEAAAREACTYALQKVPGLMELVEDELHLLVEKSSPP